MKNIKDKKDFTGEMTKQEIFSALFYLPFHIILIPLIIGRLMSEGWLNEADANVLCYVIGIVYLLIFEFKFLKREFYKLWDNPLGAVWQILVCYFAMLAMNMIVAGIISGIEYITSTTVTVSNQNNEAIVEMAGEATGKTKVIAIYLAPIVEEILFRGGIFCSLHKRNRTAAYIISILAFSVYHVWGYAADDPSYWLYIIQYIPASYVLCRCYEKTDSIWGSIFLHMFINGVALNALMLLEELL